MIVIKGAETRGESVSDVSLEGIEVGRRETLHEPLRSGEDVGASPAARAPRQPAHACRRYDHGGDQSECNNVIHDRWFFAPCCFLLQGVRREGLCSDAAVNPDSCSASPRLGVRAIVRLRPAGDSTLSCRSGRLAATVHTQGLPRHAPSPDARTAVPRRHSRLPYRATLLRESIQSLRGQDVVVPWLLVLRRRDTTFAWVIRRI